MKKALSILLAIALVIPTALFIIPVFAVTVPENGLVAYWDFEDDISNGAWDSVGDKNAGITYGTPATKPVVDGNALYLDGGTADSIPLEASMKEGNDKNLVILTQHRQYRKPPSSGYKIAKLKYRKYPQLVESMRDRHIMYNGELDLVAEEEAKGNCLVIAPKQPMVVKRIEKDVEKLKILYQQGYKDCDAMMGEIKKFLMEE